MLNIDDINEAKHIVITLPSDTTHSVIASANALYSFILTLHKKVSLYSGATAFGSNLYFLPWMDKLKNSYPSSADLEIKVQTSDEISAFFKKNSIKLNSKMAISLYAALIAKTEGFLKDTDSTVFAEAKELLEAGADINSCNENILKYISLAALRLKSILLQKMVLKDEAKLALFNLDDEDLKSSGASIKDVNLVVKDALSLPSVKTVVVKYGNKEIVREGE
ncbi:MAG: phosphoesterase [Thiovulaceae bacterium]|nr:phosphoesterase [Sulfurimonadaceae bacterium]